MARVKKRAKKKVESTVVVEETPSLGFTTSGKPRLRRPGAGRKPTSTTQHRRGVERMVEVHGDVVDHIIAKALGSPTPVTCPQCKCKFEVTPLGTGDKEMLTHLENKVTGKAPQILELKGKVELDNSQLRQMFNQLMVFKAEMDNAPIEAVEAEFRALPAPDLSRLEELDRIEKATPVLAMLPEMASTQVPTATVPKMSDSFVEASIPDEIQNLEDEMKKKSEEVTKGWVE